jgi:hypothetical protein
MKNAKVFQITFPSELEMLAKKKTKKLGISIPEYVRHLVINDTLDEQEYVEYASPELEAKLAEAWDDYKNGRLKSFANFEEYKKYFDNLADDNE